MALDSEIELVEWQIGRRPRGPFRVGARCEFGYPTVLVSPPVLEDGTLFPTFAWLTCPWLSREASAAESAGEMAAWDARCSADPAFADALAAADEQLRAMRAAEKGAAETGVDACVGAGIAGRGTGGGTKCLHARIAVALIGVEDPVGREMLDRLGSTCDDRRCERADLRP